MADWTCLIEKAFEARKNAYAPYSDFQVGACVETKDGTFIPGANVENAAYGSTMCGERNAIFGAYSRGYRKEDIKALAIVTEADRITTPCGSCRQVLSELLEPDTPIILCNRKETLVTTMEELLPGAFGAVDLRKRV